MTTTLTAPTSEPPPTPPKWRLSVPAVIIAVLGLVGTCVWTYPMMAAWLTQIDQSKVVENATTTNDPDAPRNAEQLKLAEDYNAKLEAGGASLDANERLPQFEGPAADDGGKTDGRFDYDNILTSPTTDVMSRIQIPKIDLDLPIYHGTSDETLLRGIGHLEGTALPVGGVGNNTVITGHRGLAEAEMFTKLDQIDKGDYFTFNTFGRVITYRVAETKIVDPDQTETLDAVRGKDLATLVTCTPLGINTQRILVIGERVEPTPPEALKDAQEPPDIPGFPWWAVIVGGAVVAAGGYVWFTGRPAKPHNRMNQKRDSA
ncbi:class C sortase [Brevibacterium aurantiacum]|uniref:class C sortase n=1 Tax=Brevibacterium aurantiacum TaxID=273384 RepID=UPI000BB6FFDD|nr:class C sortase [Brevibacterium aurantiacum]AZL08179.1 class C sortase [Brevibacterium aurantiacum]PCC55702.1 class C sortase [Brevibacterium aurantiacum]